MNADLLALVRRVAPRCSGFRDLAARCLGAWPATVLECLELLAAEPGPVGEGAVRLLKDAVEAAPEELSTIRGLPVEHPLDGDWRFASEVPRRLLRRLLKASGRTNPLVLACAPTLVIEAENLGVAHRCVVPVRHGDPVADAVRVLAPNAAYCGFDELAGVDAGAALVDPPWYDDVALPVIQRVCAGVRQGGAVLVSGPDLMTAASCARLFSPAMPCAWPGLTPTGHWTRVRYRTPAFEARAMMASGIRNVPALWRTGRIHEFESSGPSAASPALFPTGGGWTEVPFGGGRLWVRLDAATGEEAQVIVARSVSRTSGLRSRATAWTSANTVVTGGTPAEISSLIRPDDATYGALRARLVEADESPCWQPSSEGPSAVAPTIVRWEDEAGCRSSIRLRPLWRYRDGATLHPRLLRRLRRRQIVAHEGG